MKFKAIDKQGVCYQVAWNENNSTLKICTNVSGNPIFNARIKRYIGLDKNGREVYEGDVVLTPRKRIKWLRGDITELNGEEFRVPFFHEPRHLNMGQVAVIISYSTLKE